MSRFEVKDYQTLFGQQVLNVYRYDTDAGGTAPELGGVFSTDVIAPIRDIQSLALVHTRLEVINLDDEEDWYEVITSLAGTQSGDTLPSFVAFYFKLARTSRSTRPGAKRIAGVLESWQTNGAPTGGSPTAIAAVEDAIAATLNDGTVDYVPVIQGWSLGEDNQYFRDGSNPIQSAELISITTQNSRKVGRGS